MQRLSLVLMAVVVAVGPVAADEKPAKKPKPLTVYQAADEVLTAVKANDRRALAALAQRDTPDPWDVADELCNRWMYPEAKAFAKAAAREARDELTAYVTARLENPARAIEHLKRVLALRRKRGNRAGVARATASIGYMHVFGAGAATARAHGEQALELHEELGDRAGVANALLVLGFAHFQSGSPEALALAERGLQVAEAVGQRHCAAEIVHLMGWVHGAKEPAKGLEYSKRALALHEKLGMRANIHVLEALGSHHRRLGNIPKALEYLQRALDRAEECGHAPGVGIAAGAIARIHLAQGDFAKALEASERALAAQEATGGKAAVGWTLGMIGTVHGNLGDSAKSLAAYEQALKAMEEGGDKGGAAAMLSNMGNVHNNRGDFAKALATYERALEALEALGAKQNAATTLGNIGMVHSRLGNYAKALAIFERARAAMEALGDELGVARMLQSIGAVHANMGSYAKALATFERVLAAAEALGNKAYAARALGAIGRLHYALGNYAKALAIFERARAAMEAMGMKTEVAWMLASIGEAHAGLGDHAKALATLERALAAMGALGRKAGVAWILSTIGFVHHSRGDYAKALAALERAHAALEALGNKTNAARALCDIGLVHHSRGDHALARRFLERSASAARSLRATPLLVLALERLARLHLDAGKPSRALGAAREALRETEGLLGGLDEEQGATAREQYASLFALGALAAVREKDPAEVLRFTERGRAGALLDSLDKREALRWKSESLPPDLLRADREAQAAANIARYTYDRALKTGDRKESRAARRVLHDATEDVREVAGRIQRELKQQANLFYPRAKTLFDIQDALESDQALVLFGLCLEEAIALVLEQDSERIVSLGKVADVEAACEALDATDPDVDPTEALARLRTLLIEPLKLGKDVKQVLLSPEGPICYLPFGALFERTVAMTPSGTTHVLLLDEERVPGEGVLALGNPDYAGVSEGAQAIYYGSRSLTPLPATAKEVQIIGTKTLVGAEASEAGMRAALTESKRWRAVHFACHGLVDTDRPMLSSLALSRSGDDDGFLTALEVLRTDIPADLGRWCMNRSLTRLARRYSAPHS